MKRLKDYVRQLGDPNQEQRWAELGLSETLPPTQVGTATPPDPAPIRDEMAPNPASNPHVSGPKGHMGAQMGFTESAFSVRSSLVGGCFAQNGPQNPLFRSFWPISGL